MGVTFIDDIKKLLELPEYIYNIDKINSLLTTFQDGIFDKGKMIELLRLINEHNMKIYNTNLRKKQEKKTIKASPIIQKDNKYKNEEKVENKSVDDIIKHVELLWKKIKNIKCFNELEKYLPNYDNPRFKLIINYIILKYVEDEKVLLELMKMVDNDDEYMEIMEEIEAIKKIRNGLIYYRDRKIFIEEKITYPKNKLIFLTKFSENYCMDSDFKAFTVDFYKELLGLLKSIENGTFRNRKNLYIRQEQKRTFEIRDNDVRIHIAHIKDNIYVILSAFIKKCDKNLEQRNLLTERSDLYFNQVNRIKEILNSDKAELFLKQHYDYYQELKERLENNKKQKVRKNG